MPNEISPYSILFIEDEEQVRRNYVRYLKRHYKNVYEASDGEEALEIYKDKKPDILIVDINIPKINGLEVLRKIRENDLRTRAIMLTAHTDTQYLLKATELNLTKYLIKPITRNGLKEALNLVNHEMTKFDIISKKVIQLKENYLWSYENKELYFNNEIKDLTSQERKVLELFFNNIKKTVSYDNMIFHVWDDFEYDKLDALKTTVKNLRKKLPKGLISNVYGIGYKLEV